MKINIAREFDFSCGHRIYNHNDKCFNLHGHNYRLVVYLTRDVLNDMGMVLDFYNVKKIIGDWVNDNLDHTMLVYLQDKELLKLLKDSPKNKSWYFCDFTTTTENIAIHLMRDIFPTLLKPYGVEVARIELYETDRSKVEVINEN